jgi:beta-lactamase regulating signal transducer with metallopeptidase domain
MTLLLIAKATVILTLALTLVAAMARASAATRHAVLAAAQVALLLLPLLTNVVPSVVVSSVTVTADVVPIPARLQPAAPQATNDVAQIAQASSSYLSVIWLAGVVFVLASRAFSYASATMTVRRAQRWRDLLLSDDIRRPMTFGRHVLLPRDATSWSDERLRAVLLHERAHVRRRDTLLQAIGDLACAVYWFHPLVWVAARRARLDRERACDDLVLAGGIEATDYAAALLDVAREAGRARIAGVAMAERSQLTTRVHALLDRNVRRRGLRGSRVMAFAVTLAVAPLLAALDVDSISRPRFGEPDLRGDAVALPQSERIGAPPVAIAASGPDAALIARLQQFAQRSPENAVDFVADRARWALGRVDDDGELIAPLLQSLSDRDWRVRAYAAWTLGVAGDRRATASVTALLDDEIWRVRAAASASLRHIADPAAAEAMRRALSDDAWQVRSEAVAYFAAVGAERSLFETMRRDRHVAVRDAAEEAIR